MAHIRDEVHPQPVSKRPTKKVTAGALAGAVTTLGIAVARSFDVVVEPEVASAATVVLTFAASYVVHD